jgi:hypothetical protein
MHFFINGTAIAIYLSPSAIHGNLIAIKSQFQLWRICQVNFKKTILSTAVATTVGLSVAGFSSEASAVVLTMDFDGVFTMIQPDGKPLNNGDFGTETNYYGWRTPISGTFTFNTSTGAGSGTVNSFSFAAGGLAIATAITVQAIGDGAGGPGTLILGNLGFNWSGNNGIPVSIVLDGAGLFGCLQANATSCAGTGATPETDNTIFGTGKSTYTLPLGPSPIATTDWNTTTIGGSTCTLGCNPSGGLPLIADTVVDTGSSPAGEVGIGGSPMPAGPFPGWNANFDFTSITNIAPVAPIPVPAAVWLFGTGLLGLVGIARRRTK